MIKNYLKKIDKKSHLTFYEMEDAIKMIMTGHVNQSDIEVFLLGLNKKGITEDEITAAALSLIHI